MLVSYPHLAHCEVGFGGGGTPVDRCEWRTQPKVLNCPHTDGFCDSGHQYLSRLIRSEDAQEASGRIAQTHLLWKLFSPVIRWGGCNRCACHARAVLLSRNSCFRSQLLKGNWSSIGLDGNLKTGDSQHLMSHSNIAHKQ
jgi:hypothetical protein